MSEPLHFPSRCGASVSRRLLVVDDEPANVLLLTRILNRAGYSEVLGTSSPAEVPSLFDDAQPDIVLLDLHMPVVDGWQLLEFLRARLAGEPFLPVVVLTADVTPETRRRALARGATDFLTKPFDPTEVLLRIRNLLEVRRLHLELRTQNRTLEVRVRERTRALEEAQMEILARLAQAAELHDDETGMHTRRVGESAARLATALGLPDPIAALLKRTAPLHDVGKIGITEAILRKPGPLTSNERETMERHAEIGGRLLTGSRSRYLQMAEQIALAHHERWDGGGYPRGLREEAIPLAARIVAVVDVYDALTHDRPYRAALPASEVRRAIRLEAGAHFDPRVVEAFLLDPPPTERAPPRVAPVPDVA